MKPKQLPLTLITFHKLLWAAVYVRKPFFCISCRKPIEKSYAAYRPMTNGVKRGDRLCIECGKKFGQKF
jgi:hypothetical protein